MPLFVKIYYRCEVSVMREPAFCGNPLVPYFVQIRIKTRNTSQCVSWCCSPCTTEWWTGLPKGSLRPPTCSAAGEGWHFLLWNASEIKKCPFLLRGFTHVWKRTAASIFIFWLRSGWDFSCRVLFGCCHRHKGEGLLKLPMWALILRSTPASPFLCHTKESSKYRSTQLAHRSPRDMGREWFPFTVCYTTVCCWRHVTAAGDFSPLLQLT